MDIAVYSLVQKDSAIDGIAILALFRGDYDRVFSRYRRPGENNGMREAQLHSTPWCLRMRGKMACVHHVNTSGNFAYCPKLRNRLESE